MEVARKVVARQEIAASSYMIETAAQRYLGTHLRWYSAFRSSNI